MSNRLSHCVNKLFESYANKNFPENYQLYVCVLMKFNKILLFH